MNSAISGWQVLCVATLGLVMVLCIPALRRVGIVYLVLFGVVFASLGTYIYHAKTVQPLRQFDGKAVMVTARVLDVSAEETVCYSMQVTESDTVPIGTRLSVSLANETAVLQKYSSVRGMVTLSFTENASLYGDGIFLTGVLGSVQQTTPAAPRFIQRFAERLRNGLLEGVSACMPDDAAAFAAGVCIGDVSAVSEEVVANFRISGLAHLTVVSGLHMTIVSGAVLALLKVLRVRRVWTTLAALLAVWLFMITVGFSVSVIRASVMRHCLLIGSTFRRRADGRTSLAVALLLIVSINPYAVCDVGFLLSFTATWGLVVLMPLWNKAVQFISFLRMRRWLQNILQPIGCSLAAMIFTAPISANMFGTIAVLSPVANVLTGTPVTVMLPLTFLGGILYQAPLLRILAVPCLWIAGQLSRFVMWVAAWIASISVASLQIRQPVWLFLLFLLPFSLYWTAKLGGKRGIIRLLIANLVVVIGLQIAFSCFMKRTVSVRVATGNTTVAVVETARFTAAIVSGEDEYAYRKATRYLSTCGVDTLDVLVILDERETAVEPLTTLLQTMPIKTVVCSATQPLTDVVRLQDGEVFETEQDISMATVNGWWRIDIAGTRVLFAAPNGTLEEIPPDWRRAHLTVFRQSVAEDISALITEQAVVVCTEDYVQTASQLTANVEYPVAVNREAAFFTDGNGGIAKADRFWLG